MKRRILTLLLCLCMAVTALPTVCRADTDEDKEQEAWEMEEDIWDEGDEEEEAAQTVFFPDVDDEDDYAEAAYALAELEIIVGDEKGRFNPDKTITRAEMAVIMCKLAGAADEAEKPAKPSFDDVPVKHWASAYVDKAVELEIFSGYGNGKFGPGDAVTYEQVAKLLVCSQGLGDLAIERGGWPNGYMSVAEEDDYFEGIEYEASQPALRKDVAMMIYNSLRAAR